MVGLHPIVSIDLFAHYIINDHPGPPLQESSNYSINNMAVIPTLRDLLVDEIKDLCFAESHLVKALPKMAKAATAPDLKAGFTGHLAQTRGHVIRLTKALKILGLPAKGKTC